MCILRYKFTNMHTVISTAAPSRTRGPARPVASPIPHPVATAPRTTVSRTRATVVKAMQTPPMAVAAVVVVHSMIPVIIQTPVTRPVRRTHGTVTARRADTLDRTPTTRHSTVTRPRITTRGTAVLQGTAVSHSRLLMIVGVMLLLQRHMVS